MAGLGLWPSNIKQGIQNYRYRRELMKGVGERILLILM
jgi:hypothetical protein